MSATAHSRITCARRREKVFGEARGIPLDRNAKVRILVYARGYNARYRQRGQHRGPITRAFMEVLEALLWGFHNAKDGRCFPSYESIAKRAQCNRDTVYEAIKALEFANVLSWVNRIMRNAPASAICSGNGPIAGASSAPATPTYSVTPCPAMKADRACGDLLRRKIPLEPTIKILSLFTHSPMPWIRP